jgi:hypothetical protein
VSDILRNTLLVSAACWSVSATCAIGAPQCALSGSDIQALAASPSQLTPKGFSALALDDQKSVCETRASIVKIDAHNGVMDAPDSYDSSYLSPAENHRMVVSTADFLHRILKSKGLAQ